MFVKVAFKVAAKTGNVWSKGIAAWTGGPYSHVELWLDGDADAAWCFSSREGEGAGFKFLNLTKEYASLELTSDREIAKGVYNLCEPLDGKKYDWLGLFGFTRPHHLSLVHDSQDLFCSEAVGKVLSEAGLINLNGRGPWEYSPNELATLIGVQTEKVPDEINPLES